MPLFARSVCQWLLWCWLLCKQSVWFRYYLCDLMWGLLISASSVLRIVSNCNPTLSSVCCLDDLWSFTAELWTAFALVNLSCLPWDSIWFDDCLYTKVHSHFESCFFVGPLSKSSFVTLLLYDRSVCEDWQHICFVQHKLDLITQFAFPVEKRIEQDLSSLSLLSTCYSVVVLSGWSCSFHD